MSQALFDIKGQFGTMLVNLDQVLKIEPAENGGSKITLVRSEVTIRESFNDLYKRLREAGWTAR